MKFSSVSPSLLFGGCLLIASACSRGDEKSEDVNPEDTIGAAARVVVVPVPKGAYQVVTPSDTGSITGTVLFTGVPPGDTVTLIPAEQVGCNKPLTIDRLERTDGKVANVLVWLLDIRKGKALPLDRRYELRNGDCMWSPTIQVVAVGGTVNVFNEDPLVEQANIINIANGDTAGVAPFTDGGQIIPYTRLFKSPAAYEFSIESRPVSRAWIVALDHPYFAVTKKDGEFNLTGVPVGVYTLRAWHPVLGLIDKVVEVKNRQVTTVEAAFQ